MGLLGLYKGKVTRVRKKLVGSAVFLKLVRPLVFSDPACVENRVKVNPRRAVRFFLVNRVENQKLNQTAALLSFGRVFGFHLHLLEKHLITLAVVTFTSNEVLYSN